MNTKETISSCFAVLSNHICLYYANSEVCFFELVLSKYVGFMNVVDINKF